MKIESRRKKLILLESINWFAIEIISKEAIKIKEDIGSG
jgi:hypothetical protein